ncbi:MAG: toll/interleukin-1 receptor domain-containing protein [Chloroflexi bacterium]|nr:toll/interleukin-1 receptor domain-containing protein [Chloroflexota bacterium]
MPQARKLRVFLCHASQDKPIVRELYQRLSAEGWLDPWLDEEKLLPGQDWDMEIEKAVEAADAVIVCLSNRSVTKEGYIQRELKFVLDIALEKPEGTIFVVPLRLDDCMLPRRLRAWHYVDYFPVEQRKRAYPRLLQSLNARYVQILPDAEEAKTTSPNAADVDKTPPAPVKLDLPPTAFVPSSSKKFDLSGSALLIFFYILAGLFAFGYTDNELTIPLSASAFAAGAYFVLWRQTIIHLAVKIATALFAGAYVLWIYSQFSGWEIMDGLGIIAGIASLIVMVALALKIRSDRKPAPYFAIAFGLFLFLFGVKVMVNSLNFFPTELTTPIVLAGIASAILIWLDL